MQLEGQVAIVTGGARGIGEGIVRALAGMGAQVAVFDLDGDQAAKAAGSLDNGSVGMAVDCAEEEAVDAAVRKVVEEYGRLDIMVNNAGAGRAPLDPALFETRRWGTGLAAQTQEAWDETIAQNLRTTFVGSKAAIPFIEKQGAGAIVNIASIAGLGASPALAAYAAAKAGVINLTKSMALELAPKNIRVNAICPGFLWTRAWEGIATVMQQTNPALANSTARDIFLDVVKRGVPLGREQTPADIGNLAAFLCSDLALNITGQAISVDGGITLR